MGNEQVALLICLVLIGSVWATLQFGFGAPETVPQDESLRSSPGEALRNFGQTGTRSFPRQTGEEGI